LDYGIHNERFCPDCEFNASSYTRPCVDHQVDGNGGEKDRRKGVRERRGGSMVRMG
jgi:hypothetical protein